MAESQKPASSVNRKEKNSFLDDDIGKDFLTSWKSMSVTKDDGMDFGFDTLSTGKNKAFNFEKLDMDFGLDGDFDKLSSFKVDMSDFDLPPPSKKVAKAKETSEDKSSTGKPQGKKSQFNFFDFTEMDNFDFESSLGMVGKASIKNNGKMDISSDGTDQRSSKIQVSDDTGAFDDAKTKNLPASKGVNTSDVEDLLSGSGHLISNENDREKSISAGAPILAHGGRSSQENAVTNSAEAMAHTSLSEKVISLDDNSQHTKLDFPGPSLIGVELKRSERMDRQTRNNHQGTDVYTTPGRKEHENVKMIDVSSYCETLPLKSSSPLSATSANNNSGNNKSGINVPTQPVDGNGSAVRGLDLDENSVNSISREASQDIKDNKGNQNYTAELPSSLQSKLYDESVVDNVTLISQHESGDVNLKCDKGEGNEHLVCQGTSLETKDRSLYIDTTSSMSKSLTTEIQNGVNSNEALAGIKSGDDHNSPARELWEGEDVLLVGQKNTKRLNNLSKGFTSDVLPNNCKLVETSRLTVDEVTKRKPLMSASDRNVKNQNPTSLSEEQQAKSNSPTSGNPKYFLSSMEVTRSSKIKSIEGNKLPLVRSLKKIPDLSILKISKTKGTDKPSDSTSQRHTSFQRNPKNNMKVQDTAASETALMYKITENKSPPNLSLKRKASELPNSNLACLKPLKCLSSQQENRDFQEPPRQVVEEKLSSAEKKLNPLNFFRKAFCIRDVNEPLERVDAEESFRRIEVEKVGIHEIQKENNSQSKLSSVPGSVIESPREVNLMDLEISSTVIENDGVFERAETYAKELEDICNMLRKKHEEAKEILVRALVNNNNLLMLYHPVYEDKICKVWKFATEVMSQLY